MIWYVKKDALKELEAIPRGDARELTYKLRQMLHEEKAFIVEGYENALTPSMKKAFQELIQSKTFVPFKVG